MRKKMQPSKPKQLSLLMLFLTLCVALAACGYSNPYSREDDSGPEAVAGETISIYVDMWSNNSSELGLQSEMKQALVRWLKKSRHFSMATTPDQADYVLGGVIESSHFPGLSYGAWDRAVELRAEMKYSYHLKKNNTGEIILEKRNAPWQESFRAGADAAATEMNKRQSLKLIVDTIAENIYMQLFYTFSKKETTQEKVSEGK
ncbi:MAG: hypothetical protein HY885_09830 [Deltaproteobacteria bacterium]|nr:hypothetical protein [Deltaproteobacteria bacterium]